jgi:non-ribosomal peptide synthetase component F
MLTKITDYWDERGHTIDKAAAELQELDGRERDQAVSDISAAVREHVRVLPDETLLRAAVPVLDDLLDTCRDDGRHLVLLDTDFDEQSCAVAFKDAGPNGVLTVFRNAAPVAGSTVQTWFPGSAASA